MCPSLIPSSFGRGPVESRVMGICSFAKIVEVVVAVASCRISVTAPATKAFFGTSICWKMSCARSGSRGSFAAMSTVETMTVCRSPPWTASSLTPCVYRITAAAAATASTTAIATTRPRDLILLLLSAHPQISLIGRTLLRLQSSRLVGVFRAAPDREIAEPDGPQPEVGTRLTDRVPSELRLHGRDLDAHGARVVRRPAALTVDPPIEGDLDAAWGAGP